MSQVLLTHLRGFRAGAVQRIEAGPDTEISFGRDTDHSTVAFDPDQDDLASRHHARIVRDGSSPSGFALEDLGSSNGTYLDGQRITGRVFLRSGQVMEFGRKGGEQGPAVRFEADSPGGRRPAPPTKMEPAAARAVASGAQRNPSFVAPSSVDRRDSGEGPGRMSVALAAVVILVLAGAGYLVWRAKKGSSAAPVTADDVAVRNKDALVEVDVEWKLYDPVTGRQAYHWNVANPFQSSGLNGMLQGRERVPVFVKLNDGSIEPVIMLTDERDTNLAMGGNRSGTGFVAQRSGFILTSRTLATPWRENYEWPAGSTPALLVELGRSEITVLQVPPRWVPSQARFVLTKPLSLEALQQAKVQGRASALDGRLDHLAIGFAGSPHQIAATLASVSETEPIALLKVSQVGALPECPLRTDPGDLAPDERVHVLTWEGQGGSGANARPATEVPLSVIRPPSKEAEIAAQCQDCLWLSDGASAAGNVGAPIFDSSGRVAAVFQTAVVSGQVVAYATPIRFGVKMMGLPQH